MWSYFKHKPTVLLAILLSLWGVLSLVLALMSELSGAESYLWFVAQELDLGYVDTSSLTAFLVWIGVALGGDTAFAIRMLFCLALPLALYVFYFVVRRNNKNTVGGVLIYFLVAFSLPLLQIYGLFASSEICFVFTTALVLWAYDRYIAGQGTARGLLLGLSFALLLLSGSMGVFVILSIIISRPKILLAWRFYIALLLLVVLLSPFIWWQLTNGWPVVEMFMRPLAQGSSTGFFEVLFSVFLWFNPLLIVPFLMVIFSRSKTSRVVEPIAMTMRVMFWVFVVAMLIASSREALTGSWITPICFSIIYVLTSSAMRNSATRRYLAIFCSVTAVVLLLLRGLFVIQPSMAGNMGLSKNKEHCTAITDTLSRLGVERLILQNDERNASALNFYTPIPTISLSSPYGETSQYAKRLNSKDLFKRCVAIEIGEPALRATTTDSLAINFIELALGSPRRKAYVMVDYDFVPIYDVRINIETFPRKVLTGSRIALLLKIDNPYPYELPIGGKSGREIILLIRELPLGQYWRISLPVKGQTLQASSHTLITTTVQIPTIETADYSVVLSIEHYPQVSIPNSVSFPLQIVNPKSRI